MIQNLYKENEQDIDETLLGLSGIIDKKYGLIKNIKRVRQYFDEPKFWYYSANLNDLFSKNDGRRFHTKASGSSLFSQKEALLKCLGECIERYCNYVFLHDTTSYTGSIKSMKKKFIDPRTISSFSKKQLSNRKLAHFRIDEDSEFRWTTCISLSKAEVLQIPSQLIYLSYPYLKNEPSIYQGISTGVAGGSSLSAAIARGICEIIERDSFMIFYLNKLPAPRIDLEHINNINIQKVLAIVNRYKMSVVSLDITSDLGIPTVASIVVNHSGYGKAISVGLKCDFDYQKAIIGSIEEAFHTRSWLRFDYETKPENINAKNLLKNSNIKSRGYLWYRQNTIKRLDFWLKDKKTKKISNDYRNLTSGEKLKKLIRILKENGYDSYYKDLTIEKLRPLNYFIVKAVIPKLQPIYLNENYKLLGGDRLYKVPEKLGYIIKVEKDLNKFPHPFL